MSFTKTPPKWDNAGQEPSLDLQTNGFAAGYKPPAPYFNYLFHQYSECIKELQDKSFEEFAPSGYGLGEMAKDITGQDIVQVARGKSGFYQGRNITNAPSSWFYYFFVNAGKDKTNIVAVGSAGKLYSTQFDNYVTTASWNEYVKASYGTVISSNADFAEVAEWSDGNPNNEDRVGYFVSVSKTEIGITMSKATASSDVRGVTIAHPAFSANASDDKYDENDNLLKQYNYVAFAGFATVIDNGTCTVNERCISDDNGCAVPSDNSMGYQVIDRVDDTHILILVEPNADMLNRIKSDVLALESDVSLLNQAIDDTDDRLSEKLESELDTQLAGANAPEYPELATKEQCEANSNAISELNDNVSTLSQNKAEQSEVDELKGDLSYQLSTTKIAMMDGFYNTEMSPMGYYETTMIRHSKFQCNAGDLFIINCTGNVTNAKPYTFAKSDMTIYECHSEKTTYSDHVAVAPIDGYLVINDMKSANSKPSYRIDNTVILQDLFDVKFSKPCRYNNRKFIFDESCYLRIYNRKNGELFTAMPISSGYEITMPRLGKIVYSFKDGIVAIAEDEIMPNNYITLAIDGDLGNITGLLMDMAINTWFESYTNSIDSVSYVNPYFCERTTGNYIIGESPTKDGLYIKFDKIRIKYNDNIIEKTWSDFKNDLNGTESGGHFESSLQGIEDCFYTFKNYLVIYDLITNKFYCTWKSAVIDRFQGVLIALTIGDDNSIVPTELTNQYNLSFIDGNYYNNRLLSKNYYSYLLDKITNNLDVGNKFLILATTDVHWHSDYVKSICNPTNDIINFVDKSLHSDCIVNMGDSINYGTRNRKDYAIDSLNHIFDVDNNKLVYSIGNHDFNGSSADANSNINTTVLTDSELYSLITRGLVKTNNPDGKLYYYRDFSDKKIRVISLNTDDYTIEFDAQGRTLIDPLLKHYIMQSQVDWLCNEALNVDDGWVIVVTMHVGLYTHDEGFNGNSDVSKQRQVLREVLSKYVNKQNCITTFTDNDYSGKFNLSVNKDFSGYKGKLACVLSGHGHGFGYVTVDGFSAIQIPCGYSDQTYDGTGYSRTGLEQVSIGMISIDYTNSIVTLKFVGYGTDKEFSY